MRRTTFSFNKISYTIFGFYSIGYLTKITRRKEDAQLFLFEGILILSYLVLSLEARLPVAYVSLEGGPNTTLHLENAPRIGFASIKRPAKNNEAKIKSLPVSVPGHHLE